MKRRALVTGAEGFIGSHLVRFLQAKGWSVVGSFRSYGSNSFAKLPHLEFVECELSNGQRVEQIVRQYDPTHAECSVRAAFIRTGVKSGWNG